MGEYKNLYAEAGDALAEVEHKARPKRTGWFEAPIRPAIDFMAKLPVDSYLIGGALRDLVNGKGDDIRDFDIYVGPEFEDHMIDNMPGVVRVTDGTEYVGQVAWGTCNFDRKLKRVIEIDNSCDADGFIRPDYSPNIQLMVLKEWFPTPEAAARSVDFGICQIVYNLKTGVYCTPEFFLDCINRTFTFMPEGRSDNDRLRSIARFQRLNTTKYHGYTPVGLGEGKKAIP